VEVLIEVHQVVVHIVEEIQTEAVVEEDKKKKGRFNLPFSI